MFKSIKEFFFGKPVEAAKVETKVEAVNSTPYKVEPPVVAAPAATPAKKAKAPAKAKAPVKAPVKAAAKKLSRTSSCPFFFFCSLFKMSLHTKKRTPTATARYNSSMFKMIREKKVSF